ncbi:sugar ABC transporter ATP-binding protein [Geminicoccus roseus]|uniref:sugar ABC transporter ATP-binding protein n=1 Tax=Geminicoccus roseus TaxID=404900 RepID=UPI00040A8984|nr:sugar ABC transporter ATP-binding protein [Geminicoccus roseus]
MPADAAPTSYRLEGITKTFPGVVAASDVNMHVRQGEIHGIIGRNGAGKSVLVSMIAGILQPSSGRITVGAETVDGAQYDPVRAHSLGVSLIPQEPRFAKRMSVTENLFMGRPLMGPFGFLKPKAMRDTVRRVADELSLDVDPEQPIGSLPIETQQLLAFGKAQLVDRARVILLDEITASLSRQRKTMLLERLRDLVGREPSRSYTLISHHVNEILEFCDRVTVMRDGQAVATLDVRRTSSRELADWIVGDIPKAKVVRAEGLAEGGLVYAVRKLGRQGAYQDVDLELRAGRVTGLAGLDGSGKDELAETLFGLVHADQGEIQGEHGPARLTDPAAALADGVAYLAKHREQHGVIQNRSIQENILISSYPVVTNAFGFIRAGQARALSADKVRSMKVKAAGPEVGMSTLSGGNKQKVLISRLSLTSPRLFVLNEPTRGVDLATKPEILNAIRNELSRNSAVVMLSENEDELIDVCDEIHVFFRGRVVEILRRGEPGFDIGHLYRAIQGV